MACDRACEHVPGSRQRMTHAGGGTSAVPQGTRMTLAPQRHATSRSLGQGTHGPAWHMASHLCTWQFSHRPHTWIKASAKQTVSYTTLHCSVTCDIPRATQPEHGEATWDNAVRQAVTACVHRGTLPPRGSHSPSLSSHARVYLPTRRTRPLGTALPAALMPTTVPHAQALGRAHLAGTQKVKVLKDEQSLRVRGVGRTSLGDALARSYQLLAAEMCLGQLAAATVTRHRLCTHNGNKQQPRHPLSTSLPSRAQRRSLQPVPRHRVDRGRRDMGRCTCDVHRPGACHRCRHTVVSASCTAA